MAVGLLPPEQLSGIAGIRLSAISAGIYKTTRPDVVLIELAEGSACSAVFTRNAFAAAPVSIAREHIAKSTPRYCLINAGNANAGTGAAGLEGARAVCRELSQITGCNMEAVVPFSTGVIGEPFPENLICSSLPALCESLNENAWEEAARAIMTTDTLPKGISKSVIIDKHRVTITGISKGAGMIRPDMATMLAFIATDASIEAGMLDQILLQATEQSFNRICVDGDTSTNDACVLMATGRAANPEINSVDSDAYRIMHDAVTEVCTELAQSIVRDGEGATKFMTIEVTGGRDREECLRVGYGVATSPLVKTAFFASDPNWGRILAAIGRSGIENLNIENVSLYLGEAKVVEKGGRSKDYSEAIGLEIMKKDEITVRIDLNRGNHAERIWTCDISHEYVRINAEYRS